MAVIIESQQWFNELRNGVDFSQNLTDFTTAFKANVGEKVKYKTTVLINNVVAFGSSSDYNYYVQINTDFILGSDFSATLTDSSGAQVVSISNFWENIVGLRIGDSVEIYDSVGASVVGSGTIDGFDNNRVRITGSFSSGLYSDGEVRNTTPLYNFNFVYNLLKYVSLQNSDYLKTDYFNVANLSFSFANVGEPSPVVRSTSFVIGEAVGTDHWNSGVTRMRYVDEDAEYQQRFEIEHEFIVHRINDGNLDAQNPPNDPFNWGTLNYTYSLARVVENGVENQILNTEILNGSVGWFNENFNNDVNQYSINSIDYLDLNTAEPLQRISVNTTTRITAVVDGANFVLNQPVAVYHSKIPTKAEIADEKEPTTVNGFNYSNVWVNDVLRNDIGAVSNSSTIIENFQILLNSPTQVTIQFDLVYTGNELIEDNDNYLFYFAFENDALTSNNSNRVSLIGDFGQYLVTTDEADLFFVDSYKIYNHLTDFEVDTPTTDFEGYIEDGVLLDIDFRIKLFDSDNPFFPLQNRAENIKEFEICLIAFNQSENKYFYITRQEFFRFLNAGIDFSSINVYHLRDWSNSWDSYDFLLNNADQFNKAHKDSPTYTTDVQYISNDDVYATYRARIGIKINWQEVIKLNENFANGRTYDTMSRFFNSGGQNTSADNDVNPTDEGFVDASQLNNGLNRKTSNYKLNDWYIRPLVTVRHVNENNAQTETSFYDFLPEWKVFDYDSNSNYTGQIQTFLTDGFDLQGKILQGEDNKIVITFDDGNIKTDVANFEGVVRIEVKNQSGFAIHELSTVRDTYPENILKGFGTGGTLAEKSIVADKYTITCLLDGTQLDSPVYKITGRIFDKEIPYNPEEDVLLTAWYDASGLILNTDNNFGTVSALGEVEVWKNLKLDANYDLIQNIVARRPLFDNIKNQVVFSTPNDFLYWLDNDLGAEYTIFAVVESLNVAGSYNLLQYNNGSNNLGFEETEISFEDVIGGTDSLARQNSYETGANVAIVETGTRGFGKAIRQHSFNRGTSWKMEVNNTPFTTPNSTQNTPNTTATNTFTVGAIAKRNGTPNVVPVFQNEGYFHEILIFANQDVAGKEDSIYTYLATKWGI